MTVIPEIMQKPLFLGKTARFAFALAAAALLPSCAQAQVQPARDTLRAGWESTPDSTKPHLYWYWLNGIVTQSGISRDLELMAKKRHWRRLYRATRICGRRPRHAAKFHRRGAVARMV